MHLSAYFGSYISQLVLIYIMFVVLFCDERGVCSMERGGVVFPMSIERERVVFLQRRKERGTKDNSLILGSKRPLSLENRFYVHPNKNARIQSNSGQFNSRI